MIFAQIYKNGKIKEKNKEYKRIFFKKTDIMMMRLKIQFIMKKQ